MLIAHQIRRPSKILLLGLLLLCGLFSAMSQAEIWHSTKTNGMNDAALAPNGIIWLTGRNGAIWMSDNIYGSSFTLIKPGGFGRITVAPDSVVWTTGIDGSLWKFTSGTWTEIAENGIADVAIAPDGKVWLVKRSGAISFSSDQGKNFTQITDNGFKRISVAPDGAVWVVATNGVLWKFAKENWIQTTANGIGDVAIAPNGLIWLAAKNGAVWSSSDDGVTFNQDEHATGIENIAAGRSGAWAVGLDGTLWRKLFSPQF